MTFSGLGGFPTASTEMPREIAMHICSSGTLFLTNKLSSQHVVEVMEFVCARPRCVMGSFGHPLFSCPSSRRGGRVQAAEACLYQGLT